MSYLEEAALMLRNAAAAAEASQVASGMTRRFMEDQERIAHGFAELAAIERGLLSPAMVARIIAEATGDEYAGRAHNDE